MFVFKQHVPGFISGCEPVEFKFRTFPSLMKKLEKVVKPLPNYSYAYAYGLGSLPNCLMTINDKGTEWWVVGMTDYPLQNKLPHYHTLRKKK